MPLKLNHPAFESVDGEIFTQTFTPDCMAHACVCREEDDRPRNDACCRFGADVLVPEKTAILRRAPQIAAVLKETRRDPAGWFDEEDPERDPDAPGGILLRTATRRLRLSSDFDWYSCAGDAGPSVYRLMRGVLASLYDDGLVAELDRLEREHLRRRLRVAPRQREADAHPSSGEST